MMRKWLHAVLVIVLIAVFIANAFAIEKPKKKLMDNYIAVFDLETRDVDKKISRPLTESIRLELVNSGKYEVIDRGNMNKILDEQKFQKSGCVAGECIVEAGQLLGVGKIIAGSVSIVGKTYYLSLSLINVQSGKIEKVSEDKCKCEVDELIGSSKRLVKKLLREQVAEIESESKSASEPEVKKQATLVKETDDFVFYDLTVIDKKTKLMWTSDGNTAEQKVSWNDAQAYISNLNKKGYAGYSDWRLPTKEEFEKLADYAKTKGIKKDIFKTFNEAGFKNIKSDIYWSSTTSTGNANLAWIIYMWNGYMDHGVKSKPYYVWPVRSGQ